MCQVQSPLRALLVGRLTQPSPSQLYIKMCLGLEESSPCRFPRCSSNCDKMYLLPRKSLHKGEKHRFCVLAFDLSSTLSIFKWKKYKENNIFLFDLWEPRGAMNPNFSY